MELPIPKDAHAPIDTVPSAVFNFRMATIRYLTEKDIDYLEQRLRDVFATKEEFTEYRSELLVKLDEILTELKAGREEQTVLAHQVSVHEDRLTSLEGSRSV